MLRKANGQSLVELGAAMIVVIPLILLLIDLSIIAIAAGLNDAVCRDSARAAAAGPPASAPGATNVNLVAASSPYKRALSIVRHVYNTTIPAKVRETLQVVETVNDVPPAPQGGAVTGQIAVHTTIDVYPPFMVRAITPTGIALTCRHAVPYTYVVPNTTM